MVAKLIPKFGPNIPYHQLQSYMASNVNNNSEVYYVDTGITIRTSELPPNQIIITNPHYTAYPEQVPTYEEPKQKSGPGKEIVLAFMACVVGIILFSLFMGSDDWYYGVPAGIGGFIVLRSLYGCYKSKHDSVPNLPKPTTTPIMDDNTEDPVAPV